MFELSFMAQLGPVIYPLQLPRRLTTKLIACEPKRYVSVLRLPLRWTDDRFTLLIFHKEMDAVLRSVSPIGFNTATKGRVPYSHAKVHSAWSILIPRSSIVASSVEVLGAKMRSYEKWVAASNPTRPGCIAVTADKTGA